MLLPVQLPAELVMVVLSHLPLQSLHTLRRLNREWRCWFDANASFIYQNAAFVHAFIPSPSTTLRDAVNSSKKLLPNHVPVDDWHMFCQLRFCQEAKWAGLQAGDINWSTLSTDHYDVHRIKVDEDLGIVITTHKDGGINVRDLYTDEVLWALPRTYVRRFAHCEYEKGFLIWDRGIEKEVWRLASQYESSPAPPDEVQQLISHTISRYMPTSKGHFKPWAILTAPDLSCAFRFVYPTLAVVGTNDAWLFDVLSCQLVKTVSNIQAPVNDSILGDINYAELSSQYLFICGTYQLRIFDRLSGSLLRCIPSPCTIPGLRGIAVHHRLKRRHTEQLMVAPLASHPGASINQFDSQADFVAVHVDTDGKSVVAMLSDSRLLVIQDIVEFVQGKKRIEDSAMQVVLSCADHEPNFHLPPGGVYLAVEHGKVGVITNFGVFILTLDPVHLGFIDSVSQNDEGDEPTPSDGINGPNLPFKHIRPSRLLPFSDWAPLSAVNCLQMTPSKMYFAWSRHYVPREVQDSKQSKKSSFDNGDLIFGYGPEGDKVVVSQTVLSEIFSGQRVFESMEEVEEQIGSGIRRLLEGAGETIVFSVDFSV